MNAREMWTSMGDSISMDLRFTTELRDNLRHANQKFERAAIAATNSMAPVAENYMKNNAPWTDQTSNARNGLAARAYTDRKEYGIILFHQVSYGIFLETRWNGKFAIINPTIDVMGPRLMDRYKRILERM